MMWLKSLSRSPFTDRSSYAFLPAYRQAANGANFLLPVKRHAVSSLESGPSLQNLFSYDHLSNERSSGSAFHHDGDRRRHSLLDLDVSLLQRPSLPDRLGLFQLRDL